MNYVLARDASEIPRAPGTGKDSQNSMLADRTIANINKFRNFAPAKRCG